MAYYQQGRSIEVPIGDFAPDLAPNTPGIILDGYNAVRTMKGLIARPSPVKVAPALPGVPLGGYVALYSDGSISKLAATAYHIYRLVAGAWVIADTTGPFNIAGNVRWRFTQFNDDVIAVAVGVSPQVASGAAGTFSALGGTPPANMITAISVGGVVAGYVGSTWNNSAANTDNDWVPDVQTQAANGTLYDYPGNVVAAAALQRAQIVFKSNSLYVLTYIGGYPVWFNALQSNITGTWGQECVIVLPNLVAFLGTDDFYSTSGGAPSRIPNNLKEWFFNKVNPAYLANTLSWYDPTNSVAYWHAVSQTAPYPGVPDFYVGWNMRTGLWVPGYLNTPYVIPNTQPGMSAGLFFDLNNQLWSWSGSAASMSVLTGFFGQPSRLTQLLRWKTKYNVGQQDGPVDDQMTVLQTYVLGVPPTVGPVAVKGSDDWMYLRATNRYLQAHVITYGNREMTGYAYEARESGTR